MAIHQMEAHQPSIYPIAGHLPLVSDPPPAHIGVIDCPSLILNEDCGMRNELVRKAERKVCVLSHWEVLSFEFWVLS